MKIINPGPGYGEPWSIDVTCYKCQSVLTVELEDLKRGNDGGYNELPQHCIYWTCPLCGTEHNVAPSMYKVVEYHRPELKRRP